MVNDKLCCGIVTFNPKPNLFEKVIEALNPQIHRIYIYDNGSGNYSFIKKICYKYKIKLLSSHNNRGIAYALNRICENAIQEGYQWILTLDHDTIIAPDYVKSIELNIGVGIICPNVKYVGIDIKKKHKIGRYEKVEACMTSGSIMSLKAWEKVGKFDEWLFIDSVDNDICYKMRQNGYIVVRDEKLNIIHNLGNPIYKKILFYNYIDYQYSALRIYYIVRNRIYITKKYWRLNGLRFVGASFKILFNTLLSSMSNHDKLKSFNKGIKDGISKITSYSKRI